MADPLSREDFRTAIAQAVDGVLNVYHEVDAMMRELTMALAAEEPRFGTLVKKLVRGAGRKSPDARFLRDYHASVFSPADSAEDEDEEEKDEEEEDDEEGGAKKARKPLTVPAGSGVVIARAAIYDRSSTTFEPTLTVASLRNWQTSTDIAPGTPLRIRRGDFRRLMRDIDRHRWAAGRTNTLKTTIPVHLTATAKGKPTLVCELASAPERIPLFDITPATVLEIAGKVRATWGPSSPAADRQEGWGDDVLDLQVQRARDRLREGNGRLVGGVR